MNVLTELFFGKHSNLYKFTLEQEQALIKMRIKYQGSFADKLPVVKKKTTVINEIVFEQGDIIVRPMYNKITKFYLKHFGYYYGSDKNNVAHIVNKEADGYVHVRTLEDFMKDLNDDEISIIKKPKNTTIKEIVNRGKVIELEPYTALDNNCQHFINFSVFGKYDSLTSEIMKNDIISKFKKIKKH
jgi:hypothetical protein